MRRMEGAYLYYDTENSAMIRSGKAVGAGRTVLKRCKEHAAKAADRQLDSLDSAFYYHYPSKDANLNGRNDVLADFEDLTAYYAIAFDREKLKDAVYSHGMEGSLFHWGDEVMGRLGGVQFPGNLDVRQKQLHMVGYLFELCYDLCIASDKNISKNPGFETPLGVFK